MKHTLKRVNGKYFADGKEFNTLREALEVVWTQQ